MCGRFSTAGIGWAKIHEMMSINDVPDIRDLFGAFHLTEVLTSYTIGAGIDRAPTRAELLISNFRVDTPG